MSSRAKAGGRGGRAVRKGAADDAPDAAAAAGEGANGGGEAAADAAFLPHALVGYKNFHRSNPRSDRFPVHRFLHFEVYCADASSAYRRFERGLGLQLVARSDQSTGNALFASYVLKARAPPLPLVCVLPAYQRWEIQGQGGRDIPPGGGGGVVLFFPGVA